MNPHNIKEIALKDGTVRYYDGGRGRPLVFVHGLFTNMYLWRKVVAGLEGQFRCIAPALPFAGRELPFRKAADLRPPGLAAILREFLKRMDLKDPIIIANDTGGALTQIMIAEDPDAAGGLVFTNCDALEVFPPAIFVYLRWMAYLPGSMWLMSLLMRPRIMRRSPLALGLLSKRRLPDDALDAYVNPFLRNRAIRENTREILKDVRCRYTLAAAKRLSRFRGPVRLAWAREDRLFPWSLGERLAGLFANAEMSEIKDSGCFSPEDQPEAVVREIREFAGKQTAAKAG